MKLSVVLAARNEEPHLIEQLNGIAEQLRPDDEMILIDDASSDATREIIDAFALLRDVLTVRFTHRAGINRAFNTGALCAAGDWLIMASGHDRIMPGCVAAWVRSVARFPDVRLVCGETPRLRSRWPPSALHTSEAEPELFTIRRTGPQVPGPGVFIRRDEWEFHDGYNCRLRAYADWYMNHAIALRHGFVYLRQTMAVHRIHDHGHAGELADPDTAAAVAAELVRLWLSPENADILPLWLSTGLVDLAAGELGTDLRKAVEDERHG